MKQAMRLLRSVTDPAVYLHAVKVLHFYGYSHVHPRRAMQLGAGSFLAPNVSLRNGERISIGERTHVGERSALWAGNSSGRITIGSDVLIAPGVFVTASNYGTEIGEPIWSQPKIERDIVIGDDVWLGANVVVLGGVTIGSGAVIGAGAIVTRSVPPLARAVGVPAKVVGFRGEEPARAGD